MLKPTKTLTNYYYFFRDAILYEISLKNDKDKCGIQIVKTDGTQEENDAYNANIFPHIRVSYTLEGSEEEKTIYYWYQNLIKDGDMQRGYDGEFVYRNHEDNPDIRNYYDLVKASVNEDIEILTKKGCTLTEIKRQIPYYITAKEGDTVTINGKQATITWLYNANIYDEFSDNKIIDKMLSVINKDVRKSINDRLKRVGKVNGEYLRLAEKDESVYNYPPINEKEGDDYKYVGPPFVGGNVDNP